MPLGNHPHRGQPQSRTRVHLVQPEGIAVAVKHPRQVLLPDAAAVVVHAQHQGLPGLQQAQGDAPAALSVSHRVGQQVQQQDLDEPGIGADKDPCLAAVGEADFGQHPAQGLQRGGAEPAQIKGLHRADDPALALLQDQGGVLQQSPDLILAPGQAAQVFQQGSAARVFGQVPHPVRCQLHGHQGAAQAAQKGLVHHRRCVLLGPQKKHLLLAQPGDAQQVGLLLQTDLGQKAGGLRAGDGFPEESGHPLSHAVLTQDLPGLGIGKSYASSLYKDRRLPGHGKQLLLGIRHCGPPVLRPTGRLGPVMDIILSRSDKIHNKSRGKARFSV